MPVLRTASPVLTLIVLAMFPVTARATTTIDFELPTLGAAPYLIIDPYVAEGVTFTSPGYVGLVKECALTTCAPCTNQWLGTAASPDCPVGAYEGGLRADFPPGTIVTRVTAEFQTLEDAIAVLQLYDASDALLASAYVPVSPAYGSCGQFDELHARGLAQVDAPAPAAYAIAWATGLQCPGPPGCYVACTPFAIDNFTFGTGPVPARAATWGRVKVVYR